MRNEKHWFRPWGSENRKSGKNDEFTHVKRAPVSTFNEKPAVELTTLFLERFQSIEAQNRPFATDVRFPPCKTHIRKPSELDFQWIWALQWGGVTMRFHNVPPPGKVNISWLFVTHRRLSWVLLK